MTHAPEVRHADRILSDPLPPATIRRIVHAQLATLRGCYAEAFKSQPTLAHNAIVRFVVRWDGQVDGIDTSGTYLPPGVRSCIERVFVGLRFPNPESRPVNVAYPIELAL